MRINPLHHTIEVPSCGVVDTVVLLHGFPDSPTVWERTSQHLLARGMRVIRVSLPGFESAEARSTPGSFDETVARLHATLSQTDALGKTLIGHDWGAIFAYLLLHRHPEAIGRFVALEVGAGPTSVGLTVFVLSYHAVLNLIYTVGSGFGDGLMRLFCRMLPRPQYPGTLPPRANHAWMYRQAWREGSAFGPWHTYYRNVMAQWVPSPELSFLFLYGQEGHKRLRFHTDEWLARVSSQAATGKAQGLPGRHWFFLEHPDPFFEALDDFLRVD